MRNPDSLRVGEPGCKENRQHQHPKGPSSHLASDLFRLGFGAAAHRDRTYWRREAARLGSNWPSVLALHAAVVAAWRTRHDPDYGGAA
jgi:hypothetical protein